MITAAVAPELVQPAYRVLQVGDPAPWFRQNSTSNPHVPAIGNVINYDVPEDPNVYFHRIGRTARAGGEGKAISLVSNDRVSDFGRILAQTKLPIRKLNDELGIVVPVIAQRQASFGRGGGGYRWRSGYGSRSGYRNEYGGGQRRYGRGDGGGGGSGGYRRSRTQTGYGRDRRRSRYGYSGGSSNNNY